MCKQNMVASLEGVEVWRVWRHAYLTNMQIKSCWVWWSLDNEYFEQFEEPEAKDKETELREDLKEG